MLKYEPLEHTADIGLYIYGRDLLELFQNAGEAFGDLISDIRSLKPQISLKIHLTAADREELLVRFLKELLFIFDARGLLFSSFRFEKMGENELVCEARGERFNPETHPFKTELKAVTYHQLKIEEQPDGLRASVIFDI